MTIILGDCIHVLTKTIGKTEVSELKIDSAELKERYERNDSVYKGKIIIRDKLNILKEIKTNDNFFSNDGVVSSMKDLIITQISTQEHYTIMIIKLNHDSIARLSNNQSYLYLTDELAHIYHFHLHPEHRPNNVITLPKFNPEPALRYFIYCIKRFTFIWYAFLIEYLIFHTQIQS